MQANIHTPQRLEGESFSAYQERRIASKKAVEEMTLTGEFRDRGESGRTALRNAQRQSGEMKKHAGSYGRGLRNWINNQNRAAQAQRLAKKQQAA